SRSGCRAPRARCGADGPAGRRHRHERFPARPGCRWGAKSRAIIRTAGQSIATGTPISDFRIRLPPDRVLPVGDSAPIPSRRTPMRGPRLTGRALVLLAALLPAVASARVAPPIHVRWVGGIPAPAKASAEFSGRFEIEMGATAVVDDLRLEGKGWSVKSLEAAPRLALAKGDRRAIAFRATPADPAEPLVVRGSIDGQPFQETFRFDEASLSGARARGTVLRQAPPRLSGTKTPSMAGGQVIRFTGRFM